MASSTSDAHVEQLDEMPSASLSLTSPTSPTSSSSATPAAAPCRRGRALDFYCVTCRDNIITYYGRSPRDFTNPAPLTLWATVLATAHGLPSGLGTIRSGTRTN